MKENEASEATKKTFQFLKEKILFTGALLLGLEQVRPSSSNDITYIISF